MRQIPLHWLQALVCFAESDNLVQAAAQLGITQPALSKQLIHLDQALPYRPFSYQGRRKILSTYGEQLYLRSKERLGQISQLIEQTNNQFADAKNAKLKIGGRREILQELAAQIKFDGALEFLDSDSLHLQNQLLDRELDIAITQFPPDHTNLIARKLFQSHFQLVVPKVFLPEPETVGRTVFQELLKLPFLAYRKELPALKGILDIYVQEEPLKYFRITENWTSLMAMAEQKLGWTLAPSSFVQQNKNYWNKPLQGKLGESSQFYLVYQKELGAISWFRGLLKEIIECGQNL